jgi:hypothetical protein
MPQPHRQGECRQQPALTNSFSQAPNHIRQPARPHLSHAPPLAACHTPTPPCCPRGVHISLKDPHTSCPHCRPLPHWPVSCRTPVLYFFFVATTTVGSVSHHLLSPVHRFQTTAAPRGSPLTHRTRTAVPASSVSHCRVLWTGRLTGFSFPCAGQAESLSLGEACGPTGDTSPSMECRRT